MSDTKNTTPEKLENQTEAVSQGEFRLADSGHELERGLKSRHIQFLALGGAIGTGLFIGSGSILSQCGPASLLMGYLTVMVIVWFVMNALAEIVVYLPLRGITVPYFVTRYVDPSLGFASSFNYWYAYAILVAAEATAGGLILDYWKTKVHIAVWMAIILVVILFLNVIAVEYFGESEFWFASIKFITIIGLIILGIVIFFGGAPEQDGILGFGFWKNPGAFVQFNGIQGSGGRFLSYWRACVMAGFAFITSPELIGLAAGEAVFPRRTIPKAARRFVYRLAIFYGLGSLVIGVVVASNDPRLLGASGKDASGSPFVLGIQRVGIKGLNHVINAAILTSAWSAGNSFLYSGSRILYSMALQGQAPKIFTKTTKNGVPIPAVLATWAVGLLSFLNVSSSGAEVFAWFSNITTISGYIAWVVVLITYIRFRKAMIYNNMLDVLPFKTRFQPYTTWFSLVFLVILTITNGWHIFLNGNWDAPNFVAAYITLPVFIVLYVGHKIFYRTRFLIPIHEIDVISGKQEMDELEAMDEPPVPRNIWERFWFWLA